MAPGGYSLGVESETIVVQHEGVLDVRVIESSRRAVAVVGGETGLTRVFLDLSRAATGLGAAEIFELCASQRTVLLPGTRVAVLYRPGQFETEKALFAETASLNRGVILRTFADPGAARRWLADGKAPDNSPS